MFSVKSAYSLGLSRSMLEQDRGATSLRLDGECPGWKLIWNCPVPPKVKNLAWKICKNALATKANLKHRHITITDMCEVCGREAEDTFHVSCGAPTPVISGWR